MVDSTHTPSQPKGCSGLPVQIRKSTEIRELVQAAQELRQDDDIQDSGAV